MPERFINSPIRMNSGTATRMKSVLPRQAMAEEELPPPSNKPKPDQEPRKDLPQPPARQLPPIDEVTVLSLATGASLSVKGSPPRVGGGGSGSWRPPTPEQEEWERAIGYRGEEIIYMREIARVKALAGDESKVVWVSQGYPGSDFDINSIDDKENKLWIEVLLRPLGQPCQGLQPNGDH